MRLQILNPVQLCSRCAVHEIASWALDNQLKLEPETIKQIREELKDIKLKEGECLVCNHNKVADSISEKILSVLETSKTNKAVVSEFKNLFGLSIKDMNICM